MTWLLAQIDPSEIPQPGTVTDAGGGFSIGGIIVLVVGVGLAWFLWRRRAGRRSAAALERVAETVDPTAPGGRYPRPPAGRWDSATTAKLADAEAFLSAVPRRCIGCGRRAGVAAGARPLVDICASCEGRVILALGDGNAEVKL